jgi:hypothetical protein
MQYITIAIIVLFASCLAMGFLDTFILDCPGKTAEYQEKKIDAEMKKNGTYESTSIPSGPCSNAQQRVRSAFAALACSIAVLLFVYGLLTGQFNFWAKKNA